MNEKIEKFNKYFAIIPEESSSGLRTEVRKLASKQHFKYNDEQDFSILRVWDNIERDKSDSFELKIFPQIIRAVQALPTSSVGIEQTFSTVKLVKTLIKNQLGPESLEATLLIMQAFPEKTIEITDGMMNSCKMVKESFNLKRHPNQKKTQEKEVFSNLETSMEILLSKEEYKDPKEENSSNYTHYYDNCSQIDLNSIELKRLKKNSYKEI